MSYKQKNVIAIKRHSRIILSKEGIKEFFMKKSKEYVGIVLTFIVTLMLVGMISGTVKAENIRSGEYEYSLSSGDATIEKYLGSATDVIIPSTLDGYEVKGIDYDAFLNSKISKVTIPEGITRISFEAFKNCESLSTVNFNAVNCEGTVSPVFAGCKNLKTINIGSKVTLIGSYMFANVPAENIVLPTSVKEIDYDAFANSELKSITIPENVQNISFEVFKGCKNFKDIYYGGSKQGWLKIRISDNNKELKNATIHFAKIQVQPSKVLKANKKKKAKKVKIKILKVASSYGYRVQVSTTKNFKKKILDKKVKKCSFTLSNSKLKKKKKLYVRVQNSQLYNGKVLNSSWSKAYKVKIK